MGQNPSDHMRLHGFCSISILGQTFLADWRRRDISGAYERVTKCQFYPIFYLGNNIFLG